MPVDAILSHMKLTETLLELHRIRCSCVVRFERGSAKKQLMLSDGALEFAESNLPEEHLVQVLIQLNHLSRQDLKKVSALMQSGKGSDEAVVLATGLDGRRLEEGVREQALMILQSLFSWSGAEIRLFDGGGVIRRSFRLAMPLPVALVEAARRAAKDHSISSKFLLVKGRIIAEPIAGLRACLPLNSIEAYAYAQVRGPIPVAHLLSSLPSGGVKPEELIRCLLLLGFLRLEDSALDQAGALAESQLSTRVEELLRHFEVANLYEILSVPTDARQDDIKAAYHEMAKQYHPDRFASKEHTPELRACIEKLFTYFTGAYTTLSDPIARANYEEMRLKKESRVEATLQGRAASDHDNEKMAETLFNAGRVALKNGEFEKAVSQLRESAWLCPDTARYHHYLGAAQAEISTLRKEAEQHLLRAIALEHMNTDTYLELGKLYLKVNLPKRAEAQFCEALHWDPENPVALKMLQELGKEIRA